MIPAAARCGVHAEVAAVDVCKRCGRFLCGECLELVGEDPYCSDCVKRLGGKASPTAWVAFIAGMAAFGLLFFALFFPPIAISALLSALTGLGSGLVELWRIRLGRSSRNGRVLSIIGVSASLGALPLVALFVLVVDSFPRGVQHW